MAPLKEKLSTLFFPALIFTIAFLQYANTISHEYAWDDKLVITENMYTIRGIKGLPAIFMHRVSVPNKNVYRPVPQALFAIEYDLFHGNAGASHFFSVLWYALLCVVVFRFVRFLFPQLHPFFAFTAALLFAVHPLHVEVVANIKSRDETLALLFGLCAVMLCAQSVLKRKWWLMLPALFFFILGMLSKENVVTLLPVIFLTVWYRGRSFRVSYAVVAALVLAGAGAGIVYWIHHTITTPVEGSVIQLQATVLNNEFLWTTAPGKIIPTSLVIIGRYLWLFIFPHPLVHLYGYNQVPLSGWTSLVTWLVIAFLLYATWYVVKNVRQKTPAVFGIIWFVVTYSMYSNLFVLAPDTMAERYLFFPSVGLVLVATALLFRLAGIDPVNPRASTFRAKTVITGLLLVLTGYFIRTWVANRDWKNDFTLIYNRIKYMQNNAAAQATYGLMLYREGGLIADPAERSRKRVQSMQAFMRSIEIYPDFYWSWISAGKIFAEEGMYQKAELAFLKAQQLQPLTSDGYFCLGSLYYTQADSELAINYLEKAVLLDPEVEQSYVMLGKAYLQGNKIANLGALAQHCMKKFGHNAEFYALMAFYCFKENRQKDAGAYLDLALQKDPHNMTALILRETLPSQPGSHH